MVEDEKWRERYAMGMKFLRQDSIGYYKRALKRRQSQVRWLKKKLKKREARPDGS